ncbi:zinc finger and BTB domain-containing protein 24 isoform X2 [Cyclopterus lumpus]|uniref:zinc finger and BTB domain-containing protein 24 isoform X2 n=1 Tax=Cyclopterus lumpus TaxID=8103 RepID=UPI001486AC67|nr:zinc finger and BTB domain-containing protein 24 isoform X2 [Cyclopterus lumpus]
MSQKATDTTSSPMALHSDSHKQSILSKFDTLRKRDLLCDITLVVGDVQYKAHKALLAASSEYFSLMFTAEDQIGQSTYRLDGMAAETFAAVLDFIYSARVSVEESAAEQLLATARLMEVNDLVQVLARLSHSTAASRTGEVEVDPDLLSRCKRGRPKKNVPVTQSSEERLAGRGDRDDDDDDDDGVGESPAAKNDAYCNSGGNQSRKSKRKVRPPVKYKGYKVGNDTAGGEEPGKRGRKRKYPDTEPRCEDCGKVFKNHLFLKIHQRTHTGEKPFTCEICGKCFTAKSTLQTHIRIHRGEKPYDCTICNKSFSDPSARRRHVASHSGKKPFTCSFCSLSFTRLDNLKTHIKSHNKERASEAAPEEEARGVLQLQQYQLPSGSEQEIQLVVTGDVDNINFVPGQNQEIIIATEGDAADSAHPRLTLLAQSAHQNVALVAQDQSPQIQTLSMLDGHMTHQPEQMHVITLSKEAMEHLQAHHGPQRPVQQLQVVHQPIQHLAVAQGPLSREQRGQAIHISSQSSQPISISQTHEQISSHHIQGQTFQIQAGTVSYLYTTGQES